MTLRKNLRGFRALTAVLACAGLAVSPAVAAAKVKHPAKKSRVTFKEAHNKKPSGTVRAIGKTQSAGKIAAQPTNAATGLGDKLGLSPTTQLAAMNTAIKAAPGYFVGRQTLCNAVTPMLAVQRGDIMAGNFRDAEGNCYVWLNVETSSLLTGSEICKTALHEMGHLSGLQHSTNPLDVMFAPFISDPIPPPCQATPSVTLTKAKAGAAKTKLVCPPGAVNSDYCQVVAAKPAKSAKRKAAKR
jgi:hypothetical protein